MNLPKSESIVSVPVPDAKNNAPSDPATFYSQTLPRYDVPPRVPALCAPVPIKEEVLQSLIEFAQDCCSPEGYGLALSREIVVRAARLVKLSESCRRHVGHDGPPPVRCEACDSE